MDTATPPIVGSAEPLTREQTVERLRDLEAWGVDLSLICMSLRYTPTERIERMLSAAALAQELRDAWARRGVRAAPEEMPASAAG
jgi:hypothetical protein